MLFDSFYRWSKPFWKAIRTSGYSYVDRTILCRVDFVVRERVKIDDLQCWSVFPEMGFDVVTMVLRNGRQITMFDEYDDLIGILQREVPERELRG